MKFDLNIREKGMNMFLGIYALTGSQGWLTIDDEMSVQNLIFRSYAMTCGHLGNYLKNADLDRNV